MYNFIKSASSFRSLKEVDKIMKKLSRTANLDRLHKLLKF